MHSNFAYSVTCLSQVFCGGLSYDAQEGDVEDFFDGCGEIESVELVGPQPSALNTQPLPPRPSTLKTLNTQPGQKSDEGFADLPKTKASLNPQPSTLNPQPSTLNPQPSTLCPKL